MVGAIPDSGDGRGVAFDTRSPPLEVPASDWPLNSQKPMRTAPAIAISPIKIPHCALQPNTTCVVMVLKPLVKSVEAADLGATDPVGTVTFVGSSASI